MSVHQLFFLLFFYLVSCSQHSILLKTGPYYSEKRISSTQLVEWSAEDYLRKEYAQNKQLKESYIKSMSKQLDRQGLRFADLEGIPAAGQTLGRAIVLRSAQPVEVMAKLFIEPLGDFVRIHTPQGDFLIRDESPRLLLSVAEYDLLASRTLHTPAPTSEKVAGVMLGAEQPAMTSAAVQNFSPNTIDYFNHSSEEERLVKITWFCATYKQYKKYENYAVKKQITVGMPEHLLALSWGRPEKVEENANQQQVQKIYFYQGNYTIVVKNGHVDSWKK